MLNYKQLYYFWNVAKAGSIARAAERLHLTPQTISGQVGELEQTLANKLFRRSGRRLELTSMGKLALSYADEIFQIGKELEEQLSNPNAGAEQPFRVGIADVVPKSIACRLLMPSLTLTEPVRLICQEDKLERLFAELAIHKLDLVIADRALPSDLGVRGYSHELGRCAVTFHAAPELAARYRQDFPNCLNGAPFLISGINTVMRGLLGRWFSERRLHPRIIGEFDDTSLMKVFGEAGAGVFAVPAVIAEEIHERYGVEKIGFTEEITVRYFAISVERRLTHPAVVAVSRAAKQTLFTDDLPAG